MMDFEEGAMTAISSVLGEEVAVTVRDVFFTCAKALGATFNHLVV
jgi:hypothetical protein